MIMTNKKLQASLQLLILLLFLNNNIFSQDSYELNNGWSCVPASSVKSDGEDISLRAYKIFNWNPAVVPGTVLTTMVANKQVPDPFYGMNNQLIPDIFNTGRGYYTYWFVNDFQEMPSPNGQVWLHLRGVNYSCNVYLNGHKMNDAPHKGMFLRQVYNITAYLNKDGNNRLAIIVYPPDPVGNPNGGQGGDGTIAKNVSHQYVAGWDWIQPIRDRNTGIWDKVFIERTGVVDISNPHIITLVKGKRKPGQSQEPAVIKMTAELSNAGNKEVTGLLQYTLHGRTISKKVTLASRSITQVALPEATLKNPKLWWPNGYGRQDLYKTELRFTINGWVSDKEKISFGVREIQREWNSKTNSSQFFVNGQPIFIKGGNWIVSDAMLRLSPQRYDAEIRFHRDMNLNLIRVWGGALLERPEFYEACDRYGLLVFQDLWMTGDCNGRWADKMKLESTEVRRLYPDDHGLFLNSVADQVKMIRNYASLAIWCGGNEIAPPEDILSVIKDSLLPSLDGTRYFFEFSNSDSMSHNTTGTNGDGPYNIQDMNSFWQHRTYAFNSEVGSVGTGDYESLLRFIPQQNMQYPEYAAPVGRARAVTKTDSVWNYHKYIGYDNYINAFGTVTDTKDFATKAQLINYNQYRGLVEGLSAHMWEWYTGSIIWKTQNPWTALRGQMYDYYLDPNACLYGLRTGSEMVHAMYNPVIGDLMVVNNGFEVLDDLTLTVKTWNMEGKEKNIKQLPINVSASAAKKFGSVKDILDTMKSINGVFLSLELKNAKGFVLSDNFYWLPDQKGLYSGLTTIKPAPVVIHAKQLSKGKIEVTVSNSSKNPVAFFNRFSLVDPVTKKRLLPVFYSDNYISVVPGRSKKIIMEYMGGKRPLVSVSGWNVKEQYFSIN
jgi:mannosylglycoprotein endo-beta-mannosidase